MSRKKEEAGKEIPNVLQTLKKLRTALTKETKRLGGALERSYENGIFTESLEAVEGQLKGLVDYWEVKCVPYYKSSDATSHLFHEHKKTLEITLVDTNQSVTGRSQKEIFVNAIKELGVKACYDACVANEIFALTESREFLVDTKPQSYHFASVKEGGVFYYIFVNLDAKSKAEKIKQIGKLLGCKVHASYH